MLPMPFVRPSGAPSASSQSPANPLAVARMLSGDPSLPVAMIPSVLGATIDQLVRDKSSVLYGGTDTKSSGAPSDNGKAATVLATYIPRAIAKGDSPEKPTKPDVSDVDQRRAAARAWVLQQLTSNGIDCQRWTSASDKTRDGYIRQIFYGARPVQVGTTDAMWALVPRDPSDLIYFVNESCGIAPTPVPATFDDRGALSPNSAAWFSQVRAAGVTCDQWINADDRQRYGMIQSLIAARIVDDRGLGAATVAYWFDQECRRAIEPATSDPAASIRSRLRSILDCTNIASQDKVQQVAAIQRAFPELSRDSASLYRLALARYDLCNPPPQIGWTGGESPAPIAARQWQRMTDAGWRDPLDGDIRGMSDVQWVRQGGYMPASGPDLFDPVQGMTGDCYLIAALASLAWTMPQEIARIGVPVAGGHRYLFGDSPVTVSDRVATVILRGFQPLFASGPRLDAQWPGVVEKAYAAWRTNDTTDRPRVAAVEGSGGGPRTGLHTYGPSVSSRWSQASPIADLIGGREFWYDARSHSADELWSTMRGFCTTDGRIQSPTVACARPMGSPIDPTGIVPNHAYSLLGIGVRPDGRKFYALRNPWGFVPDIAAPYQFMLPSRFLGRLNLNSGEGGCFAVAHDVFSACFDLIIGSTSTRYP